VYRAKLSGPLLDRIDIRLSIPRLTKRELLGEEPGESSSLVRARVCEARERQRRRYVALGVTCNAHLPGPFARRIIRLSHDAEALLVQAVESFALTGRGFDRALKVAQTIADLEGTDEVRSEHVGEALSYRATPGVEAVTANGG
jgi:magnesium chelatase family protein